MIVVSNYCFRQLCVVLATEVHDLGYLVHICVDRKANSHKLKQHVLDKRYLYGVVQESVPQQS